MTKSSNPSEYAGVVIAACGIYLLRPLKNSFEQDVTKEV
jgi:hypothetical protein